MLTFSQNLNSSQKNVEAMKEMIENKLTPGIRLKSSESESEVESKKKAYLKKKRGAASKVNEAPTPFLKKDVFNKEELKVYDEVMNLKFSQAELTKLVVNVVHFINKLEKKWLGTPEEEDEKDIKNDEEGDKNEDKPKEEINKIDEEAKKKENPHLDKKKSKKRLILRRAPKQNQYLKGMQIEKERDTDEIWNQEKVDLREDNENIDISQLEIFRSWNFIDSVSDLNKSAAIVAGRVSEDIKNQVVQTFNPEEINKENNVLVNQTVQEISFQAKRDYEKEIQEKIKKELENFNNYIKEREKEMNEKSNLVSEILKKSTFQPLIDEMRKIKEEVELKNNIVKQEREEKEKELKKWLIILENIYTQDKEKFDSLKEEIGKKENIGIGRKLVEEIEKVKKELNDEFEEKTKNLDIQQTEFIKKNLQYHVDRENELYNSLVSTKEEILNIKNRIERVELCSNKMINPITVDTVNNKNEEFDNMKGLMMNVQQNLLINQKENREMLDKALEKNKTEIDKGAEQNKIKLEELENKLVTLNKEIGELTKKENEWKTELNKKGEIEKINKLDVEIREKINKLKEEILEKYDAKLEKAKKEILENKVISLNKELLIQMGGKDPKDNKINESIIKITEEIKYLKEKNEEIKYELKGMDIKIQALDQEIIFNRNKKESKNEITVNPRIEPKVEVKIEGNTKENKEGKRNDMEIKIEDLNIIEERYTNKINIYRDNLLKEIKNLEKKVINNIENLENIIGKSKKEILNKNDELIEEKLRENKLLDLKKNINTLKIENETLKLDLDLLKKKESFFNEWKIKLELNINELKKDLLLEKEKNSLEIMNDKVKILEENALEKIKAMIKKKIDSSKDDLIKIKTDLELDLRNSINKILPKNKKEEEKLKLKENNKKEEKKYEKKEEEKEENKEKEEKDDKDDIKTFEKSIKIEKRTSLCSRENCEYCRNIEENMDRLSKTVKELSEVQSKFMNDYNERINLEKIDEKDNEKKSEEEDEEEEEKEDDNNEDKENLKKRIKSLEERLENLESKGNEEREENSDESKTSENENINMEECRNIKELNKKLIRKNYEKNNKERFNESLKIRDLLKKYWTNINNKITLKRETLNNIDDEKIIIGYIEKEDCFIKKKKIKKKWEKIKIIEKEKKNIWKLNLKEEMDLKVFKDKEGDLCIYNEEEEEVVKKYCGFCLEDTHEKKNCWNILKMVNCVNINWEETQIKENICCLCGGFHRIDNINNIKKFKCSMINKIIEIVLYMTCNTKKSFEEFELIKDKKKDFEKEIDNVFNVIADNYDLILRNVNNEDKLNNNWFKSVIEIVKFIKLGYKLWNMKGKGINNKIVKRNETKSIKILGRTSNKKNIIAEMYSFLKKIDFLKLEIDITQKDYIKWKRNIKEKGIELKNNMLFKIYWKILEINLVWKMNEILHKNKDVEVYINKENNLFKRIFNKVYISNLLKEENNLKIKKVLARYIQQLKDKKNEKKVDDTVNRILEEIKDLEDKEFKGKVIKKEKKEEVPMLNINDYIDDKEEEIVEDKNKTIWLNENFKQKKKKKKKGKSEGDKKKEEKENDTKKNENEDEIIEIIEKNEEKEKEKKEEKDKKNSSKEIKEKEKKKEYSEDKKEENNKEEEDDKEEDIEDIIKEKKRKEKKRTEIEQDEDLI